MVGSTSNDGGALVVGAGPVGLTMACELLRHGVPCRIIDQNDGPTDQSRALGIQARTLEVFENVGAADRALARGRKLHGMTAFSEGRRIAHLTLDLGEMDTPYPFILILPQGTTERILIDLLEERGGVVERRTRLTALEQDAGGVRATLADAEGRTATARADWLVGCDGARSAVRHALNLSFEGVEYEEQFLLADVRIDWDRPADEAQILLTPEGPLVAFPFPEEGRWRLVATNGPELSDDPHGVAAWFQTQFGAHGFPSAVVSDPTWASAFRIHRRVAGRFRVGRCFVAGDAAHIHSPAGGQGMNTGIQDAYNLAWKLGLVAAGAARDPEALLNSFESERRPVAAEVLRGTDWATRVVALRNPVLRSVRNHLATVLGEFDFVRRRLSRGMSELGVNYRRSPVVAEDRAPSPAGLALPPFDSGPHPGDRTPDVALAPSDSETVGPKRLFDILRGTRHTLLLFEGYSPTDEGRRTLAAIGGAVRDRLGRWVSPHMVVTSAAAPEALAWDGPVIRDVDGSLHDRFGAGRDCLYLIRPDGYVGYRCQPADADRLNAYLRSLFLDEPLRNNLAGDV